MKNANLYFCKKKKKKSKNLWKTTTVIWPWVTSFRIQDCERGKSWAQNSNESQSFKVQYHLMRRPLIPRSTPHHSVPFHGNQFHKALQGLVLKFLDSWNITDLFTNLDGNIPFHFKGCMVDITICPDYYSQNKWMMNKCVYNRNTYICEWKKLVTIDWVESILLLFI